MPYGLLVLSTDDRLDIMSVLAFASQALDRADGETFASVFTADAVLDTGAERETGSAQLANLAARQSQNAISMTRRHTTTTAMQEMDEGVVHAMSYVLVTRIAPGPRVLVVATGTYDDQLLRTADGWRITQRVAVADGAWNLMI